MFISVTSVAFVFDLMKLIYLFFVLSSTCSLYIICNKSTSPQHLVIKCHLMRMVMLYQYMILSTGFGSLMEELKFKLWVRLRDCPPKVKNSHLMETKFSGISNPTRFILLFSPFLDCSNLDMDNNSATASLLSL